MTARHILMSLCMLVLIFSDANAQLTKKAQRVGSVNESGKAASKALGPVNQGAAGRAVLTQSAADVLEQFKSSNTGARFYGSQFYQPTSADDEARGGMTAVYGTVLSVGSTPEESAWNHFNELRGALGTDIGNMIPEVKENGSILQGVLWNEVTQSYKFQVLRFNQYHNSLPVFRSGVGFLVRNQNGNPLVMSGFNVKDLTGNLIASPDKGQQAEVSNLMLNNVGSMMDSAPVERSVLIGKGRKAALEVVTDEEEFVVFAGANGEFAQPELAVSFVATRGSIQTVPDYHKHLVIASAATGDILYEETLICHCTTCMPVDVDGKVEGRATQGLNALECDPEAAMPLPYAEVSIGGTTVNADANGDFTIPNGGSGNVTVTSRLRGTWFEVFDQAAGGSTPQLTQTVSPPGPANFLHNPTTTDDEMTANVNAYVEANRVRDFVLNYEPNFPTIWNQTGFDINTQVNGSCNAFYNGSSINFYANGGGCNNTSFSDVVHHEYGHHLINVSGNGQGQMGEGSGDTIGVLIQDDPVLGQGFSSCGNGIRTAVNNLQYPCSGGIHECGQLISGCVWDTLTELKASEGSTQAAIDISAQLFLGMLIVRGQMDPGQSTIAPDITVIYLELDDDDGDIGNGTPHYDQINVGFSAHNMDPPPLNILLFDYPNGIPELIPHNGGIAFTVEVQPGASGTPQSGTANLHVDFGGGFETHPMGEISPNVYQAIFPTQSCGTIVDYYVSAQTTTGITQTSPNSAPDEVNSGIYASVANTTFYDNGQSSAGWSVSGDATDGQWDRGVPVGGGDRGDPSEDGDGSGACWLTDNEDGNSDVDGGSTILTSPTLNGVGGPNETALLKYRRFYSNDFGADPMNDVFVVEISNNGGASWVNLEIVGPAGSEVMGDWIQTSFRISDFIAPSGNMRVRFNASDLSDGSVVEAGVDGLEIVMVDCQPPEFPFSTKFLDGVVAEGTLSDSNDSDNVDFMLDPSPTNNPFKQKVEVIFLAELSNTSPTNLEFRVEASMNGGPTGDVKQTVQLFNRDDGIWETLHTQDATLEDTCAEVAPTGDLTRFVHPSTGEALARVKWDSESFDGSTFFWSIDLDQAAWDVD